MGSRSSNLKKEPPLCLSKLEKLYSVFLPKDLFQKADSSANSRDRIYTPLCTFWCMIWQYANSQASGREVVRQLQCRLSLDRKIQISVATGAYFKARKRLEILPLLRALFQSARAADNLIAPQALLANRRLLAVDGSTLTLPDSPQNRIAFPPTQTLDKSGFPIMRISLISSLLSGAVIAIAHGCQKVSELALLKQLSSQLRAGDVLVGDRLYGCFPVMAWLLHRGVDFIGRTTRKLDPNNATQRLSKNEWITEWKTGSTPSPWMSPEERKAMPETISVRVIRSTVECKGFRTKKVTIVTTLLDPIAYPTEQIFKAFLRRWRLEMLINDLKTTLGLEMLRGLSPDVVHKELLIGLLLHNLTRCTMAEAAKVHDVPLDRISFKGSIDAVRQFSLAMAMAKTAKQRKELWDYLLETIASDLVPERPGRNEPRAVRRKKNKYPKLKGSRSGFVGRPKRSQRRTNARLRKQSLK